MFKIEDLKLRRRAWMQTANIITSRRGWLLEDCTSVNREDLSLVRGWVEKVKEGKIIRAVGASGCGKGLLLWGEPGHGKTTVALAIIQEMMTKFSLEEFDVKEENVLIRPCYFTTFNDILDIVGDLMGNPEDTKLNELYDGILGKSQYDEYNIRVLVIDDLGKEHASLSGWQKNVFHHVLRTRFNNGLPTIVTTNIELSDWASLYGEATESFAHEAFYYMPLQTADLRK